MLKDKVIVVTGGNGLLGREILSKIKLEEGIAINADLNIESNDGFRVKCDVTHVESVEQVIQFILDKYGRIDGWVNSAYPRTSDWGLKFEEIPVESWRKNVDMQMNSVFIGCQKVIAATLGKNTCSIVNISSIYGSVGPDFSVYDGTEMTMPAAYSMIKGGVVNFTRYLASYYGKQGVRVNCVSPGGIFDNQNEKFVKNYESKVPMGRMGLPEDISPTVCFLLSDKASYITGQNIIIDGGWTAI